jgi:hypothetical protein
MKISGPRLVPGGSNLPPGTNRAMFQFLCIIFILVYFLINGLAVVNCVKNNLCIKKMLNKVFCFV